MTHLRTDQLMMIGERPAAWANRLRQERGVEGVEWYEKEDGGLALRSTRKAQSRLEFPDGR